MVQYYSDYLVNWYEKVEIAVVGKSSEFKNVKSDVKIIHMCGSDGECFVFNRVGTSRFDLVDTEYGNYEEVVRIGRERGCNCAYVFNGVPLKYVCVDGIHDHIELYVG